MCGCENNSIQMIAGETRQLEFEVCCADGTPVVQRATFTLTQEGETMKQGDCDINGSLISALISPEQPGSYELWLTYTIAPNTRKARWAVYVHPDC